MEWFRWLECLPSKYEALSSNPSDVKQTNKKNQDLYSIELEEVYVSLT
jgi:hypothetical protein